MDIRVPIYELNDDGSIKPNFLFHRTWDRVHSRCIEYPWCAHRFSGGTPTLDVGSAKGSPYWLRWLRSLDDVYLVDVDSPEDDVSPCIFVQGDVRNLPFDDGFFETIFAVSVLEHIGLPDPQAESETPDISETGDIEALQELVRVLKPNGQLLVTLPLARSFGLILDGSARGYSPESLDRFTHPELKVTAIEGYGYRAIQPHSSWKTNIKRHVAKLLRLRAHFGGLHTWKRLPLEAAAGDNLWHTDGIVCVEYRRS